MDSLFTLILLAVCLVAPGLFIVRVVRWDPPETFCAAVASSCVLIYLFSFSLYIGKLPAEFCLLLTCICFGCLILFRSEAIRLFRNRQVQQMLLAFGILWLWVILLLLVIRHYAGGTWSGDWLEHYQRSLFFPGRQPLDLLFLRQYALTDRPPLMNLIGSFYLSQVNSSFFVYEIVAATLNLLPVLPVILFAQSILSHKRRGATISIAVIVGVLAASPMFMQNVTYVWTKSFAEFFALLAIWFYLRGWQKNDPTRLVAAFVIAAAGCLVHYSIVPYFLAMGAHYLIFVWRARAKRWRELGLVALLSAAMLMTWFGWAIANYGRATFMSNLTVTNNAPEHPTSRLNKIESNLVATAVPYFLRHVPYSELHQNSLTGTIRDYAFCLYQTNAIFAPGSIGAFILMFVLLTRRAAMPRDIRRFWLMFVPVTAVLGVAVAPIAEPWGVAHLALQPLVLLGLAVLIGSFTGLPRPWRFLLMAGLLIDFPLGVFLHVHLENRTFELIHLSGDRFAIPDSPDSLSHSSQYNFFLKQYSGNFLGDAAAPAAGEIQILICLMFAAMLVGVAISALRGSRLALAPPRRSARPAPRKVSRTNRSRQN